MEGVPNQGLRSFNMPFRVGPQQGTSLIALIGILAVISIGLSIATPALIQIWDRRHQDREDQQLRLIAHGIQIFLEQNKAYPPSLASLVPDYVPFSAAQIAINARGYPRYYAIHPAMTSFNNSTGLSAAELVNARFLVISNLSQDAAPIITTPADFDVWWAMDESLVPNLHIHRGNVGDLFYSLLITPEGNGASFLVSSTPATDSGGGLLPTHNAFHLVGTTVGFDEAATYIVPEVQFALTTNTAYWFDPHCPATKQWNPLDPICGGAAGTVKDEFTTIAYNGNDGTQNWANNWQETGEADGPTSGQMQVVLDAHCAAGNCFQFGGGGPGPPTGVTREADLSGSTTATLTFSYRRSAGANGGTVKLSISGDGGTNWTVLQTYKMNGSDASQVPQFFDITAFIAANNQIRFEQFGPLHRLYYVDNIQIAWH